MFPAAVTADSAISQHWAAPPAGVSDIARFCKLPFESSAAPPATLCARRFHARERRCFGGSRPHCARSRGLVSGVRGCRSRAPLLGQVLASPRISCAAADSTDAAPLARGRARITARRAVCA
jgi:hypothetical protein